MEWMILPLKRYAAFRGRSRRREFWMFALFQILLLIVAGFVDRAIGYESGEGLVGPILALAVIVPSIAVSVRRLHDTERSGWWVWISLIPILGSIALLALFCMEGTGGPNRYGGDPKGPGDPSEIFS